MLIYNKKINSNYYKILSKYISYNKKYFYLIE